jgi:hypothetical protein
MNIGELFVTLGFKADTMRVKDFAAAIGEIPVNVATSIASLAGLEFELFRVAERGMEAAAAFKTFTNQTGLSWEELQRWQIVAQQSETSAEAVASSVTNLQRNLAEIRLGRGNISPFQMLGISANQDAFAVLAQVRERIKGLDSATATNLISQMGIDASMINVLRLSNDEFEKLSKSVGGLTSSEKGSFLKAKESLALLKLEVQEFMFRYVAHMIDGFTMLVDKLKEMPVVLAQIGLAVAALVIVFQPLTAAVIGLLLILEDLAVYAKGGNSVIGSVIGGTGTIFNGVGAMVKNNPVAGGVASMFSNIGTGPGFFSSVAGAAKAITNNMTQNVNIDVHSTADAKEVAKEVKGHLDQATRQASLETNQQGY